MNFDEKKRGGFVIGVEWKTKKTNTHSGFDFLRLQQWRVERNLSFISVMVEIIDSQSCVDYLMLDFLKEERGRHTYGLQVDSKCSYSTQLTRVAEKGKIK